MKNARMITLYQMGILILLTLIGGSIFTTSFRNNPGNTWIVFLVSSLMAIFLFCLVYRISKLHHFAQIDQILNNSVGKVFSKVLLLIYGLFFLFRNMIVGNLMTNLAQDTLMYRVNEKTVVVMLLVTVVISCWMGLKNIARSAEILFIVFILFSLPFIFGIIQGGKFSFSVLKPELTNAFIPMIRDIFRTGLQPFGEVMAFIILFPFIKTESGKERKIIKVGMIAIVVSTIIMVGIDAATTSLLGGSFAQAFEYPFYNAMQLVSLRGFLERLDPLAIILMVISEYFKLVLYYYLAAVCFQSLSKKFKFKPVLIVMAIVIFFSAPYFDVKKIYLSSSIMPNVVNPIFELALPLLLWIISEIRMRPNSKFHIKKSQLPVQEEWIGNN